MARAYRRRVRASRGSGAVVASPLASPAHDRRRLHSRRYPRDRARSRARRRARRAARRARRTRSRAGATRSSDVCARWPRFLDAWARLGAARARRRRGLRVLPRRLPPRSRPAAPVGLARHRATSAGGTRPTAASCGRSTVCARPPRRSARPTRRAGAPSSCTSWTPIGTGAPSSVESAVKRALITGITGQDGRHLSEFLAGKGYQVFGLVHGQANPKIELVQDENPALELIEGDLRDLSSLIARGGAGAARRGLQPRRDQLRAALVQAGRAHRGDHRPRRAAHARGGAHRRRHRQQPDPLLPGVVVGDVRQGAARRRRPSARRSTRARRTAWPRCSATTRR